MTVQALPTRKTVGAAIRFARTEKRMKQSELAALAGLAQSTISEMERGGYQETENLGKIAQALGLKTSQLFQAAETIEIAQGALKGLLATTGELIGVMDPDEMHALFDQAAG